jgi:hypothetical protein
LKSETLFQFLRESQNVERCAAQVEETGGRADSRYLNPKQFREYLGQFVL